MNEGGMGKVFCTSCGSNLKSTDLFCSQCGNKVNFDEQKKPVHNEPLHMESHEIEKSIEYEDEPSLENSEKVMFNEEGLEDPQQSVPLYKNIWFIPLVTLLLSVAFLGSYYAYGFYVTKQVESLRLKGESLALEGDFSQAKKLIKQGLRARPNHQALQDGLILIEEGERVQEQLNKGNQFKKENQFKEALTILEEAEKTVKFGVGPFYDMLQKKISEAKLETLITQVESEIEDKKQIEELSPYIMKLSAVDDSRAKGLIQIIHTKITDFALENANKFLEKKQFSSALSIVDKALDYDTENIMLLSFKDKIQKEQASFESAEQKRLEQAMVAAAKEDEKNRTQSVEVIEINLHLNDYGDLTIYGQVKNVGTKPISSVQIYYTVYDEKNNQMGSSSTFVNPNYIESKGIGDFQDYHYSVWDGDRVEVSDITWDIE
jgi:hypothetical protein